MHEPDQGAAPPTPDTSMPGRSRLRAGRVSANLTRPEVILVVFLATTSIWNLGYEATVPRSTRSFGVHQNDSLFDLVQVEQLSLRTKFDVYLLLAQIGAGHTVVAPSGYLVSDWLDGLSDMTLELDPTGGPELSSAQEDRLLSLPGIEGSFALGPDEIDRRLLIIPPDLEERRLRLVITADAAIVVGETELAAIVNDA